MVHAFYLYIHVHPCALLNSSVPTCIAALFSGTQTPHTHTSYTYGVTRMVMPYILSRQIYCCTIDLGPNFQIKFTADSRTFAIEKQLGLKPHGVVNSISHKQQYWISLYSSTRVVLKVAWLLQG